MPTGRLSSLNTKGLHHYKQVLQMLTLANIEPWVTLYHFDLPSTLEIEENGWLNKTMIMYFEAYAKICFQHFNRYVNHWITINDSGLFIWKCCTWQMFQSFILCFWKRYD